MRTLAVILAASALVGCRSSQQPTNPFLRTTVPPPGTGEGAVVVPAEPYYPGATPAAPPGAAVTPVPVGPQPVVPPPRDLKKAVPGGDYMYHQSSVEPSQTSDPDADLSKAQDTAALAVDGAAPGALRLGGPSDAVEQALALSSAPGPAETASFADYGGRLPDEGTADDEPSEDVETAEADERGVARSEVY